MDFCVNLSVVLASNVGEKIMWAILLILSLAAFAFLMAYVLPHIFLKTKFMVEKSGDRGIKNIKETTGRTIVYQPAVKFRKYVSQYLISQNGAQKVLVCKAMAGVEYLDYDVVMFNGMREAFRVINVKELIEDGYTEELVLDEETAYVSLVLNAVNETELPNEKVKPVSRGKIATYILSCTGLTILEVFITKLCCSYAFGGVFREIFMLSTTSMLTTLLFAVVAVAINITFILVALLKNRHKGNDEGELSCKTIKITELYRKEVIRISALTISFPYANTY